MARGSILADDCPALVISLEGRIVEANRAAEELFGVGAQALVGRSCHELLRGVDEFGNWFCLGRCCVMDMAARGEPVRYFEMTLHPPFSDACRVGCHTTLLRRGGDAPPRIVHILKPLSPEPAEEASPVVWQPSSRQAQVMRLLGELKTNAEIAEQLSVSLATVRRHVRTLVQTLGARGKFEAILRASRARLI